MCMMAITACVAVGGTRAGAAHVAGVSRCSSIWACPVCAPKVREKRAREIDLGVSNHLAKGGQAFLVTATVRHLAGTKLADVLKLVTSSWTSALRQRHVTDNPGYVGQIRAVEITHGKNGWHPHIHAIVLFDSKTDGETFLAHFGTLYAEQVAKLGGQVRLKHGGWDVRPVLRHKNDLGNYLTKVENGWGAGLEMARGDLKASKKGTTPFDMLVRAEAGNAWALKMWRYYEDATKGRQAIRWTPGLKALLEVEDLTDEEVNEDNPADEIVVQFNVPRDHWHHMLDTCQVADFLTDVGELAAGLILPGQMSARWPDSWRLRAHTPV
jgi:hypothetical protein